MYCSDTCCVLCEHADLKTKLCDCDDMVSEVTPRKVCYRILEGDQKDDVLDNTFRCSDIHTSEYINDQGIMEEREEIDCEPCEDFVLRRDVAKIPEYADSVTEI